MEVIALSVHIKRYHVEKDSIVGYDHIKEATIQTAQLADGAVTNAKIADATIEYKKLADNTIQYTIEIPILGGASQSVAADAVGTPTFAHTTFTVHSSALRHLISARLFIDYAWAPTADGVIELYDSTAARVLGDSTDKTGGESSEWESFSVTDLVAANTLVIRAKITVAGAAGETVTLYRAVLRLVCAIS